MTRLTLLVILSIHMPACPSHLQYTPHLQVFWTYWYVYRLENVPSVAKYGLLSVPAHLLQQLLHAAPPLPSQERVVIFKTGVAISILLFIRHTILYYKMHIYNSTFPSPTDYLNRRFTDSLTLASGCHVKDIMLLRIYGSFKLVYILFFLEFKSNKFSDRSVGCVTSLPLIKLWQRDRPTN